MGTYPLQAAIWYASRKNKGRTGPFVTVANMEWLMLCCAYNDYRGIKTH